MRIITILFIALVLRIFVTFYQQSDLNFRIQQDNYGDYAVALSRGFSESSFLNQSDTRLFPGYPVLILLVSGIILSPTAAGYLISLVASLISIYLFWLLTKKTLATFVFAVFPPIWVAQSTKIATEPVMVLLLLISVLLFRKKMIFYSGIILGLASDIRLIAVALLGAFALEMLYEKRGKEVIKLILGFIPAFLLLFIYNYFVFGTSGIFRQFAFYPSIGHATIGFIQITQDFIKVILQRQYRALISGLFYVILSFWALFRTYKYRKLSDLNNLCFYWILLSLLFILIYGPNPLLGEYARFLVPVMPALIFGFFVGA